MVNGGTLLFHASPLRGQRIFGRRQPIRWRSDVTLPTPRIIQEKLGEALMRVDMNTLNSLCKYYNFILFVVKNVNIPRGLIPSPEFLSSDVAKKFFPVLDYSGEHNISMTSNPNGFLYHFHVICSYGLTPYRKSALPQGAREQKRNLVTFLRTQYLPQGARGGNL